MALPAHLDPARTDERTSLNLGAASRRLSCDREGPWSSEPQADFFLERGGNYTPIFSSNEYIPAPNQLAISIPTFRCKPSEGFEEDRREPVLDFSLTDSKELWLIQLPLKSLKPSDFNGKEITLQLHSDGKLGSIETSSGKSYEMLCSTVNKPDATVFLSSGSDSKIVGKISRRICLLHYPEPTAVKDVSYPSACQKSGVSQKSSMSNFPITSEVKGVSNTLHGTSHATLTSDRTLGQSIESTKHSKNKRRRGSPTSSEEASKSAGQTSRGSRPDSQVTLNSAGSLEHSKSKVKKKIKIVQ